MAVWRATIFMGFHGFGSSETYITNGDLEPDLGAEWLAGLLARRMALAPIDVDCLGVRVSDLLRKRESNMLIPPGGQFPGNGFMVVPEKGTFNVGEPSTRAPIEYRAAAQLRLRYDNLRFTTRYLTPVPRAIVGAEPLTYVPSGSPPWVAALANFCNYIRGLPGSGAPAACAIYARIPIPLAPMPPSPDPYRVLTWRVQSATPSYLGAVLTTAGAAGIAVGDKVHVYNTRIRSPQWANGARLPSLNGSWFVDAVDPNTPTTGQVTVWLRGTAGIDPLLIKNLGRLFKVQYATYAVQRCDVVRVGIHKRGRPSSIPRGRRLTRVSLDP